MFGLSKREQRLAAELERLRTENAELRDQVDMLTWERDALARARDHLTAQAKLEPQQIAAPHLDRPRELLHRLSELCAEYCVGFGYTNHDDGTHITVDGQEVFIGFLDGNAAELLRQAGERHAKTKSSP